ncbi:hypothetical protein CEUSTIGMA_g6738.t1 [Chlamydomonas eustigma]|uniref:Uncharacterized protein n=1 Tax=Chlamydomonas eustigma TaxID=1157962 RepID=A0A250X8A8_9CHLO|nr:hypothetical protein CEUSTIGMA_g6738.t1 [Chlamydomonas eustigma]|eukprot:GAX79297.1 hypothetical protein CEUSTIGMA_g6738.t1 [Chlamydomonas eustigma]
MDFTSLSANATKLAQFKIGINSQLSKASSVSYEDVLLLTLMAGSAVADNNISFPAVNFTSAQALATATTLCLFPNNTFSPQFLQEYGISKVTMVALSLSSPLPPSAPSYPSSFSSASSSSSQFNILSIVGVALGVAAFLVVLVIALFLIIHRYNRRVAPEQLEVSEQTMQKMVGHAVQEVSGQTMQKMVGQAVQEVVSGMTAGGGQSSSDPFHKLPVLIHVRPKGIAAQLGQGQGSTQAVRDASFFRAQAAARWAPGGHPLIAEFNAAGSSLAKPVTGVSAEVRLEGEELRVVAPDPIKVPSSAADTVGEVIKLTKKSGKRKKPAVMDQAAPVDQASPVDPPLSAVETVLPMKEADVPDEATQASSDPPPPAAAGPKATNKPVKVKKVKPRNETLTSLGDPIDF